MLFYFKEQEKAPKSIDLEWINNFIYANVESFVRDFFKVQIDTNARFKDPLADTKSLKKDNCQYFQKGITHIIRDENYEGKITVFNKARPYVYSNFFNMYIAYLNGCWEAEWVLTKNISLVHAALDDVKNWISSFPDDYVDSDSFEPEVISELRICDDKPVFNSEIENLGYCFYYSHGTIEDNFEKSYPGFYFSDFKCNSWAEFKMRYLITAFDGCVKKGNTNIRRYSQNECLKHGIYTIKWFRDMTFLNRIKAANTALHYLFMNYYLFEIKDNNGNVIAVRWRYKYSDKKIQELEKSSFKISKYMNMSSYRQKYHLINLHNFLKKKDREDDAIILIESLSDIPCVYRKYGDYGDHFVATGTAGITYEHLNILKYLKMDKPNLEVYLAFDGDSVGQEKNNKVYELLKNNGFNVYILKFEGKDFEDNNIYNKKLLNDAMCEAYLNTIPKRVTNYIDDDDLPF